MIDKRDIIGNFSDKNVISIASTFQETQLEDNDSEEQESDNFDEDRFLS